jgi:hypothetical protein
MIPSRGRPLLLVGDVTAIRTIVQRELDERLELDGMGEQKNRVVFGAHDGKGDGLWNYTESRQE